MSGFLENKSKKRGPCEAAAPPYLYVGRALLPQRPNFKYFWLGFYPVNPVHPIKTSFFDCAFSAL
jgi:hypothetical protein